MFKIGVGPSSSHTLGPWRAALSLLEILQSSGKLQKVERVQVLLYGSLAKTGVGHGTDIAVQLGLSGDDPVTFDVNGITPKIAGIASSKSLNLSAARKIDFDPAKDIVFLYTESLPYHPNALTFLVQLEDGEEEAFTFYSIGGGFIQREGETGLGKEQADLPFPINTAEDLLHWCRKTGMNISEVVAENELAWRSSAETRNGLLKIWQVMKECVYRGCHTDGYLPGGLQVKRRAPVLNKKLISATYNGYDEWLEQVRKGGNDFKYILDWVSCFALAVNEENASFGRVVTAPTNGAAGVIPAVLHYYHLFAEKEPSEDKIIQFLMTASKVVSL